MFPAEVIDASALVAGQALLEGLPYPALWIRSDYDIARCNAAARAKYGAVTGPCYAVTHGYDAPCNQRNEPCPKVQAEAEGRPVVAGHAHVTNEGIQLFQVVAIPVREGGVLEIHVDIGQELVRDPITGLHTRHLLSQLMQREHALLERMVVPYALVLLDVDNLKLINDTHGHEAGDAALHALGAAISANTRSMDCAGRWGGDEFLLFLPGADAIGAETAVSRVRASLGAAPLTADGTTIAVTASFGIVTATPDVTIAVALQCADKALYRAKAAGRDRVIITDAADDHAEQ